MNLSASISELILGNSIIQDRNPIMEEEEEE